jgi:hypothetical protein
MPVANTDWTVGQTSHRLISEALWRASQIPDSGPNKVPSGTEDDTCGRSAGNIVRSTNLKQYGW